MAGYPTAFTLIDVDFETLRNSKKLQALVTCDVLAIRTTGDDLRIFESTNRITTVTLPQQIEEKFKARQKGK